MYPYWQVDTEETGNVLWSIAKRGQFIKFEGNKTTNITQMHKYNSGNEVSHITLPEAQTQITKTYLGSSDVLSCVYVRNSFRCMSVSGILPEIKGRFNCNVTLHIFYTLQLKAYILALRFE
jgi:hypothetical protein